MNYKLKEIIIENKETYFKSKFFGSPVFSKNFLKMYNLDNYIFICQLNLKEINPTIFTNIGYLYLFLDKSSYFKNILKPILIYSDEETEVVFDNFNDFLTDIDNSYIELVKPYVLIETEDESGIKLFSIEDTKVITKPLVYKGEYVSILSMDLSLLPECFLKLENTYDYLMLVISKENLNNRNFSNAFFVKGY